VNPRMLEMNTGYPDLDQPLEWMMMIGEAEPWHPARWEESQAQRMHPLGSPPPLFICAGGGQKHQACCDRTGRSTVCVCVCVCMRERERERENLSSLEDPT
jgi:hypothetical protein